MEKIKKSAKLWLCIGLVLCLVGAIGASLVQTSFGSVKVEDLRFETTSGHRMSGLLFIPEGVSAENPAPAVVVSHGMYNNREMQDLNFVELSRRGFVVLSMDMFSHGNSSNHPNNSGEILVGMYEAVKMLDSLAYVDSSRIGITGHSLGGMSSNMAIALDNAAEKQRIAAVLLNCADPTYVDSETKEYVNIYGSRDAGVIAAQYDEWFFRQADASGGTTPPRDYIKNSNAQSFLHYGTDPAGQEARTAGTMYHQDVDGQDAIRVVYNPAIIHPWSHFSQRSTTATIEFFTEALGAPNPLPAGNQVWQWKVVFNTLGLIGLLLFLANFAIMMVYTPFFAALRAKEPAGPVALGKGRGKAWFWGSLAAGAVFGTLTYLPILNAVKGNSSVVTYVRQTSPWGVGMWAAVCGVFAIAMLLLSYYLNGKKNGFDPAGRGVAMPLAKWGKTLLLALITVAVSYGLVFAADFFFKVDYRIWVVALKTFEIDKLPLMLFPALPLFLIYYVANSVAVNAFNYNDLGKRSWVNTAVLAFVNGLPAFILLLMQYCNFFSSGQLFFKENMYIVWLFPVAVFLPLTAVISRRIYKATNNPYLGGLINGALITIISCANTLTWAG